MSGGGSFSRSKSKNRSQSMSRSGVNDQATPYLADIFNQAQGQYRQGPQQYYGGQTYADFNPYQQNALDMIAREGGGQSSQYGNYGNMLNTYMQGGGDMQSNMDSVKDNISGAARGAMADTAGGAYLNSNPYLDQTFDVASRKIGDKFNEITTPNINANFGASGRTGGGLHQGAMSDARQNLATELGDTATDIYAGNYQAERDRQMNAASNLGGLDMNAANLGAGNYNQAMQRGLTAGGMVGDFDSQRMQGLMDMLGAGDRMQGQSQRGYDEAVDRFNFGQRADAESLQRYSDIIQKLLTQESESSSSSKGSSKSTGFSGYGGVGAG